MTKKEKYFFILSLIAVPIIIYFYFLQWKTTTIYADDLTVYKGLGNVTKFRPVNTFVYDLLIRFFQKRLDYYYVFNISIQVLNAYLFAMIVNLFLASPWLSVLISLIPALSRLSLSNINQLYYGGALEGLAMSFFLLSLFFILTPLVKRDSTRPQVIKAMLWSILFANLGLYTHERYVVLLPFIVIVIFFLPQLKILTRKQKVSLSALSLGSIFLNVAIKNYVYSMPFFVGTGDAPMTISISTVAQFFSDAFLSAIQISEGHEYVSGIQFISLTSFERKTILFIDIVVLLVFARYFFKTWKAGDLKTNDGRSNIFIFLALGVLFFLCLVPAVTTIRVEHRFLQASFSILVLMIVIAIHSFDLKVHALPVLLFIVLFAWVNYTYLKKGAANLYQNCAQASAAKFKQAIYTGIIRPATSKLYIWDYKDQNGKGALTWYLSNGYFFDYYQGKQKEILFADSIYHKEGDSLVTSFPHFNKDSAQILYVKDTIADITGQYLKDSLKSWKE